MTEAIVAQKAPYVNDIKAGKRYAWCSCGQSRKQPFCDGSHKATDFMPVIVEAEVTKVVYFCGCKKTENQPYCDGSHNTL